MIGRRSESSSSSATFEMTRMFSNDNVIEQNLIMGKGLCKEQISLWVMLVRHVVEGSLMFES